MTSTPGNFQFDGYLPLLQSIYPDIDGLLVFDRDARLVWQDREKPSDHARMQSLVAEFLRGESDTRLQDLQDGDAVELIRLKRNPGDTILVLCLYGELQQQSTPAPVANDPPFVQLGKMLLENYCQNADLVCRKDELVTMTDELRRRAEELELIYRVEDQAIYTLHGRELLRQLVLNTSQILNVDVTYLYIAGNDISMPKYRNDNPLFHSNVLLDSLRDLVFPLLEDVSSPLVVNSGEDWYERCPKTKLPFKLVATPVVNGGGETIGLLAIAGQDSSTQEFIDSDRNLLGVMAKKASRIMESHFDSLTGLENNHSFELILNDLLRQSSERGISHSIANIDIDRLAVVNDISGHEAGDYLINMVAHKVADTVRAHDQVARLGSDKFGVLLKNCDLMTAKVIMKKVSYAVSSLDMVWEGRRHEISVSIGVAPISSQTESVTGLLDNAETARDVSKQRGRNNIHVLELEDINLLRRKEEIRWVGRIQEGLRDDRFCLYAQSIVPMKAKSNRPHYEILLRLQETDGTIVDPGKFLPAAENFYLMASLDLWVINQAFYELTVLQRGPCALRCQISINLSGQSLNDPYTLASYIENKLEEYELDGCDICFEITESAAIANLDEARVFIEQIRNLGCKFSLDDFGTGLSSFSYLKNLNVDYLKIDGSFVRDIVRDPVSESMVSAINQVGQAMQLETVAEYVENDEIKQKLIGIGVDYGQGFGFGRPVPINEIQANFAKTA